MTDENPHNPYQAPIIGYIKSVGLLYTIVTTLRNETVRERGLCGYVVALGIIIWVLFKSYEENSLNPYFNSAILIKTLPVLHIMSSTNNEKPPVRQMDPESCAHVT